MKQKKITVKDIKEFTNFTALEEYINNLISEQRKEAFEEGEKVLYKHYFKGFKNPVIIERKEFDKLELLK